MDEREAGVATVTRTVGFPDSSAAGHQVFHQHADGVLRVDAAAPPHHYSN